MEEPYTAWLSSRHDRPGLLHCEPPRGWDWCCLLLRVVPWGSRLTSCRWQSVRSRIFVTTTSISLRKVTRSITRCRRDVEPLVMTWQEEPGPKHCPTGILDTSRSRPEIIISGRFLGRLAFLASSSSHLNCELDTLLQFVALSEAPTKPIGQHASTTRPDFGSPQQNIPCEKQTVFAHGSWHSSKPCSPGAPPCPVVLLAANVPWD